MRAARAARTVESVVGVLIHRMFNECVLCALPYAIVTCMYTPMRAAQKFECVRIRAALHVMRYLSVSTRRVVGIAHICLIKQLHLHSAHHCYRSKSLIQLFFHIIVLCEMKGLNNL